VAQALRLATAPVFAAMALLTGMVTMYALMSVFHAGPWLELIARAGNAGRRRD
jgi:hypothetical protein